VGVGKEIESKGVRDVAKSKIHRVRPGAADVDSGRGDSEEKKMARRGRRKSGGKPPDSIDGDGSSSSKVMLAR